MTKYINLVLLMLLSIACSKTSYENHQHSHDNGHTHEHNEDSNNLESIKITKFTKHFEMFIEMTPLVKDNESEIIIHLTKLIDFKPITSGTLKVIFSKAINDTIIIDSIYRDGIFKFNYTPLSSGNIDIYFIYSDNNITDTIIASEYRCYNIIEEAQNDRKASLQGITFLKEEAWKIDFSLFNVIPSDFSPTIKAIGKIIAHPSDEILISASAPGFVEFIDNSLLIGNKISIGSLLFNINSGSFRDDDIELKYTQTKSNFERAKKEFERVSELYNLKITSEKEYLDAKSSFEKAEAIFKNYELSSKGKSINIKSPITGFIKHLNVKNRQFVEAGQVLAVITNYDKLIIKIELPIDEYYKLSNINGVNFIVGDKTIKIEELNGKFNDFPATSDALGHVSIYINIDNRLELFPNTYITTYLIGNYTTNSIVIPRESVWENQGHYFVFVQLHGELFEKREVKIDGFDGFNYLIGSGINIGEVIVRKGTYRVMLASKESALPSQTHTH